MSTYDWPVGQKAFAPATVRWRSITNNRSVTSALSGYTQTGSVPGARWGITLDMPRQTHAERRALGAFLARLEGNKHRVNMFDPSHPQPAGSINVGGVTLGAAASQFAQTLVLAGCTNRNLLRFNGFEVDTDGNGLCDQWLAYSTGNTGVVTYSRDTTTAIGSGSSQRVQCASMGGAETDRAGVVQIVNVSGGPGDALASSVDAWGDAGQRLGLFVQLWSGGAAGQVVIESTATLTTAWQRYGAAGVASQAYDQVYCYYWQQERPGGGFGAARLNLDQAQLERSASPTAYIGPPQLLDGDWLSVGGQRLMVASPALANDAGQMTLETRHALRAGQAAGSAVVLDRPRGLFVLADGSPEVPFGSNNEAPPFSIDLVEVFA